MSLDPRRLLVLRAVHRHGDVLAAAERLGLTPSAISQHLTRLESQTGLALVDRSRLGGGRSLVLTVVGQAVSEHADEHADDLDDALAAAEQTVAALRGAATGPVVVGAFPTAVRRLVAPAVAPAVAAAAAVAALQLTHPGVHPRVVEASDPAATQDLTAGRLDLAVLERDGDAAGTSTPGVVLRPLLRDPYRVVVPESWPPRTTAEVLAGPWVAGPAGSAARAALDRHGRRHRHVPRQPVPPLRRRHGPRGGAADRGGGRAARRGGRPRRSGRDGGPPHRRPREPGPVRGSAPGPHGRRPAVGVRGVRPRRPVAHRRRRRLARRAAAEPRRHRLGQHRRPRGTVRPVHTRLLGDGVLVLEHLTGLAAVPARGARLHAVPLAWHGLGTWPVRANAPVAAA